jgi:uncharacterized membrane protein
MAGQKPTGRGRPAGPAQGGSSRRTAGNRQGASARQGTSSRPNQDRPRQSAGTPAAKTNGNGAAAGKSRPATAPASAGAGRAGRAKPASASRSASPAKSGPLGNIVGPFQTVGFVPLATFVLSLFALGVSIYLTIAHYDANVTLVCSDKGLVNCAEVTTSSQSMVFGVLPVAVLGLAFYVFMTALNSPWVWRLQQTGSEQLSKILRYTRIGAIVTGMGFVLYLIYAELIQIRAICLWCTSVHVATFLIFTLIVFYTSFSSGTPATARRG